MKVYPLENFTKQGRMRCTFQENLTFISHLELRLPTKQ